MGGLSLSEFADAITVVGVFGAIVSAVVAYRGWRHRTGHWLYIPAPNLISQDPAKPDFWVFPPTKIDDETYALVIAGKLVNAGPSDAFSIHIYAEPEVEHGIELLMGAAEIATRHKSYSPEDKEAIGRAFLGAYKHRKSLIPVLRVGEHERFVVVTKLKRGDPYLEELLSAPADHHEISAHWETEDKQQAHGVHAASRTILRRKVVFGPEDLCAPFETTSGLSRWSSRARELTRQGSRP